MWLSTALQLILFSQVARTALWEYCPMRYVDFSMTNHDFFFDRMVPLTLNRNKNGTDFKNYGIGVLISADRILTTYNPYRKILIDKNNISDLYATTLVGRTRYETGGWLYSVVISKLSCGRQILHLPDDVIEKDNLWHGMDKRHSPLHDLLVFRMHNNFTISSLSTTEHTMENYPDKKHTHRHNDALVIKLAKPHDRLGSEFKFCAAIVRKWYILQVTKFEADEYGMADCDEWLPREWGHFICIVNKNNASSVVSGAMLVSNQLLFGVASFVLFRGAQSIIVFTDVRPYYALIYNTCTYYDSHEKRPKSFPKGEPW